MNSDTIILGGISGCFFTILSHPFHVLTTRYNREVIKGTEPTLQNSIGYTVEFLRTQPKRLLIRGISMRTLQGTLTYSFLFFVRDHFNRISSIENQTMRNITASASAGYAENIIIRQPLLTLTSAYINHDNVLSRNLWVNMVKSYPLTSLFRSLYFTSSTIGKSVGSDFCNTINLSRTSSQIISGVFGIAFCIRFNGFSESYTNALTAGQSMNKCFEAGIKGSKNIIRDLNLISRESLFLIPFLFPIDLQFKKP